MSEKMRQWGTAIYDSVGEYPLCGNATGLTGFRLKKLRIVNGTSAADLPGPLVFGANVGSRLDGDVVMSPELFMELLSAHATAVELKRHVAASGIDVPGFANLVPSREEAVRNSQPAKTGIPRNPGYLEVVVDDGTAFAGQTRSGATFSGTIKNGKRQVLYENRMEPSPREVGQLQHINTLFAEGWQYDRNVTPDLILLKRVKANP